MSGDCHPPKCSCQVPLGSCDLPPAGRCTSLRSQTNYSKCKCNSHASRCRASLFPQVKYAHTKLHIKWAHGEGEKSSHRNNVAGGTLILRKDKQTKRNKNRKVLGNLWLCACAGSGLRAQVTEGVRIYPCDSLSHTKCLMREGLPSSYFPLT